MVTVLNSLKKYLLLFYLFEGRNKQINELCSLLAEKEVESEERGNGILKHLKRLTEKFCKKRRNKSLSDVHKIMKLLTWGWVGLVNSVLVFLLVLEDQAWYAEFLLEIDLKILLRARLIFKIALMSLQIDPGFKSYKAGFLRN
jgi:hypothetical protein